MSASPAAGLRIAYLVSRFPDFSEGFIRYELREVGRRVADLMVLPLVASPLEGADALMAEAGLTADRVVRPPRLLSPALAGAVPRALARHPGGFLRVAAAALAACLVSPRHGLKWLLLLPRMLWLGALAADRGIDHLHAHFAALPANAAWTIHQVYGIPYSVTAHAYDLRTSPWLLRLSLADASFGVTVSEYTTRLARELVPEHDGFHWHLIRNGLPLELFRPPESRPARPRPLILSVGRLVAQKGFADLLEACRILRDGGTEFACLIVGEGPLGEELRRRAETAGLADRVTFAGVLTGAELRQAYARADLFVLACVRPAEGGGDTLPVVLSEAAAMGLPLVSTPVAAIPELIEDGLDGRLVPEHSPAVLAEAIRELLAREDLRRGYAARALALVRAEYDAARSTDRLVSLFAAAREAP